MQKINKKIMFNYWIEKNYTSEIKTKKIIEKIPFVFNKFSEKLLFKKKKTINKRAILFNYFVSELKNNRISDDFIYKKKSYINKKLNLEKENFYKSDKWQELRKKVHKLYKCGCMKCGAFNTETHVDHIFPRSKYPKLEYNIFNLQILCKNCNMEKSNKNNIDYRTEEQKKLCLSKNN